MYYENKLSIGICFPLPLSGIHTYEQLIFVLVLIMI